MSGINTLIFGLIIVVFIVCAILTVVYASKNIGIKDNKEDIKNAFKTIVVTNIILVILLGMLSTIYFRNNQQALSNYMMFMLHINFLLSITAVSMAALVQLSV